MSFLKRATPWMVTMVILLGAYVATYVWYYRPISTSLCKTSSTKDRFLIEFFKPLNLTDKELLKQKMRRELIGQIQGAWVGRVKLRSDTPASENPIAKVHATVRSDQFHVTWSDRTEWIGVKWKIGSLLDARQFGISSSTNYPKKSSIILYCEVSPSGDFILIDPTYPMLNSFTDRSSTNSTYLTRPATAASSP